MWNIPTVVLNQSLTGYLLSSLSGDHLYDGLKIKGKVDLPTECFNIARSTIRQYSIQCGQSIILSIPHVSVKYIHFMSEAVFLIALADSPICLCMIYKMFYPCTLYRGIVCVSFQEWTPWRECEIPLPFFCILRQFLWIIYGISSSIKTYYSN